MSGEFFISLLVQFFYVLTFSNNRMSHWFSQKTHPQKTSNALDNINVGTSP